ncbi:hypothetical protein BH11MYX3_BH11MYX3_46640 [soil metagenome]
MYEWLKAGHIIGVLLWIGGLSTVYWILRFHAQAPPEVNDKLVLMERSLALAMDLAAALAIGCGITMAVSHGGTHPTTSLFAAPGAGWFHIKLTIVVLGVLSTHGVIRARVAKFSRGEKPTVPQWLWSLLLVSIVVITILVFRGPIMFSPT